MSKKFLLTEKMREELLSTFKAAQELALEKQDIVSADYYGIMVKHLVDLKAVNKRDYKEVKPIVLKDTFNFSQKISPKMTLKETLTWLLEQDDMTPDEKFDLYYEERERIREAKGSRSFKKFLKELKIDPSDS